MVEEDKGPPLTLRVKQHLLCFLVLNKKEIGVKLNICIIVKSKTMHINKVILSGGNMKDIHEGERSSVGGNNGSTNTGYVHT
jgi:hypothetical protein